MVNWSVDKRRRSHKYNTAISSRTKKLYEIKRMKKPTTDKNVVIRKGINNILKPRLKRDK